MKFASFYAPFNRETDSVSGVISDIRMGSINYPQVGDRVLAAVWITDRSEQGSLDFNKRQNLDVEVIIVAKINYDHPVISPYDNIIMDKSGAKIHINHGWKDLVNMSEPTPDYQEEGKAAESHHVRTGHLTVVGNRVAVLSGQKFLPFGLFSHLFGRKGETNPVIIPASTEGDTKQKAWNDVFTDDPTDEKILSELPDTVALGSSKFLEPPCPPLHSDMKMHDSGWKRLIEEDGHTTFINPSGTVIVIGENSTDFVKSASFAQSQHDEEGRAFPKVENGVIDLHLINGDNEIKINVDPKNDIVRIEMANGTLIWELDGASDSMNITTTKLTITGDVEVTGEVKGGTGKFG
jgi:hypothetical protein